MLHKAPITIAICTLCSILLYRSVWRRANGNPQEMRRDRSKLRWFSNQEFPQCGNSWFETEQSIRLNETECFSAYARRCFDSYFYFLLAGETGRLLDTFPKRLMEALCFKNCHGRPNTDRQRKIQQFAHNKKLFFGVLYGNYAFFPAILWLL
jgi:hypothetical protein